MFTVYAGGSYITSAVFHFFKPTWNAFPIIYVNSYATSDTNTGARLKLTDATHVTGFDMNINGNAISLSSDVSLLVKVR